jgi:hypothetical protein
VRWPFDHHYPPEVESVAGADLHGAATPPR